MPKKNRIAIYELLFKEGVMVAKKDVHLAKHPELADKNVPNLHVMKAMQVSLYSGTSSLHVHSVLFVPRQVCCTSLTLEQLQLCLKRVRNEHLLYRLLTFVFAHHLIFVLIVKLGPEV